MGKNKKKLKALCDIDEIICDFLGRWLFYINQDFNTTFKIEEITDWNLEELTGLGPKIYDLFKKYPIYLEAQPIQKNIDVLKELHDQGHIIYLVTAMDPIYGADRVAWLKRHMPWFDRFKLIISRDKTLLEGDVFIDDAAHNVLPNNSKVKILIDAPYNRGIDESSLHRVKDLTFLKDIIDY